MRCSKLASLFDHLVGEREQVVGDSEPKRLGGLEVDHQLELDRNLNGKLARLRAAQDAVCIDGGAPIIIAQVISIGQKATDFGELPVRISSGETIARCQRLRDLEVWVKPIFGYDDPAAHWRRRLHDGLAHILGLVIAKAVHGELAADVPSVDAGRQIVLFGARNGEGWGVGLTIFTALGNLLPVLPEEDTYPALFHGARRVAADCEGQAPRQERAPLASKPDLATLKRWLRRWTAVRHREAAERTVLTAIAAGASPAALADVLLAADTDRTFVDSGHSLDFFNKAFECLDLIGWEQAGDVLPTVVGQMVAVRGAEESTSWRQPEDLVSLCQTTAAELPGLIAAARGGGRWSDHAALAHQLLGDDAVAIVPHSRLRFERGLHIVDDLVRRQRRPSHVFGACPIFELAVRLEQIGL
jgi:hypothetical protein